MMGGDGGGACATVKQYVRKGRAGSQAATPTPKKARKGGGVCFADELLAGTTAPAPTPSTSGSDRPRAGGILKGGSAPRASPKTQAAPPRQSLLDADDEGVESELYDEVAYAVDGLAPRRPRRAVLASLAQLAELCGSVPRRRRLRSAKLRPTVLNAVVAIDARSADAEVAQAAASVLLGACLPNAGGPASAQAAAQAAAVEARPLQVGDCLRFLTALVDRDGHEEAPSPASRAYAGLEQHLRGVLESRLRLSLSERPAPDALPRSPPARLLALCGLEFATASAAPAAPVDEAGRPRQQQQQQQQQHHHHLAARERLLQLGAVDRLAAIVSGCGRRALDRGAGIGTDVATLESAARVLQSCTEEECAAGARGGGAAGRLVRDAEFLRALLGLSVEASSRASGEGSGVSALPFLHLLVNLTNNNGAGCEAVRAIGGLPALSGMLAALLDEGEEAAAGATGRRRDRLDVASTVLCLLTNCVEESEEGAAALAALFLQKRQRGAADGGKEEAETSLLGAMCALIADGSRGALTAEEIRGRLRGGLPRGCAAPGKPTSGAGDGADAVGSLPSRFSTSQEEEEEVVEEEEEEEEVTPEELVRVVEEGIGEESIIGSYAALLCCMLVRADHRVAAAIREAGAVGLPSIADVAASFVGFHVSARTISKADARRAFDAIAAVRAAADGGRDGAGRRQQDGDDGQDDDEDEALRRAIAIGISGGDSDDGGTSSMEL